MGRAKKKLNGIAEPKINSEDGLTQEKQQQRKSHSKGSTDGGKDCAVAALPTLAVEIPREDWPSLPQFKEIEENFILCKDAESKESKSIQCDCKHSSKELKRGKGCGEECLNRLLLMECRSGCPSGKYCTNKRFQRREYADMELFYTGAKGWGMRAKQDITQGQFIIEYVGEVIGSREMQRRIRRYGQDPNHKHHYLMALRSGTVIDATTHGNFSRFINHSCDPNAATQKWTVGRQLRIGFFALKVIKAGEEIVFNYQFERYGKRAQKCLCGSTNCTGYIGATGREDSGEEEEGTTVAAVDTDFSSFESDVEETVEGDDFTAAILQTTKTQQPKRKKGRPPKCLTKIDRKTDRQCLKKKVAIRPEHISDPTLREAAEVSELLAKGPLRNREQVLEFNRIMVRVDQMESRRRMVDFLLAIDDPNILRLFVAHQGLAIIRIWFVLPPFDLRALQLQSQIARLLLRLPVTNKNQVDEVCIMSTLNQMINMELPDKTVISEMVSQMVDFVAEEAEGPNAIAKSNSDPAVCEFEELRLLSEQLTDKWTNLVTSDFRIPKKLSKTVSKMVTKGMAVLQNNKHKKFVPRGKMASDGCKNHLNEDGGTCIDGFGSIGENDREWQYRRFRNHFERRIRQRGGQPFFYQQQQNITFSGSRENMMMHLGGQLYNDPEYEPPPCFFNAPPRVPKLFPDPLPSPSVLAHPNMAHSMVPSHFYAPPSPMLPHPYCLPPAPSPFHPHHLYYAQNGAGAMLPMAVHAHQPLPPPPPPPPPPERNVPEDEELEMDLDGDSETEEDPNTNSVPNHSATSSLNSTNNNNNRINVKKEMTVAEEGEAIDKNRTKENDASTTATKDTPTKRQKGECIKQQKREKQKSAKDLIKESLQRRILSLKAQLGTKATPPIWGANGSTDTKSSGFVVKIEKRWSRSRSLSQGSVGSRSRPSSTTPDSSLRNRSRRSPYKEQKKEEDKRGNREDKGVEEEQHDEAKEKQYKRRRSGREEEGTMRRRRSGPGKGGRDRSHGHNELRQSCERRMSLSPDRTGGTDPHIDRRGRRSSPGRRGGRFGARSRCTVNNMRFFERRNRGRWSSRKTNTDSNTVPRRRGGTYDRIRAQLAEQAYKQQQLQDKKEETKLSPEEELQKQQELNSKKAVINAYTEKLKGLIQPERTNSASTSISTFRQRSVSTSSTSSTSSSVSSTSTTSSGSSSTTSSTSSSSSTSTENLEKKDSETRTGRSSPKGVEPPQQIMLKRMIGADGAAKGAPQLQPPILAQNDQMQKGTELSPFESAQMKKGRFVAAFKIAPSATHLTFANNGTKSAAVAKAFVSSDGCEDGEEIKEETSPNNKLGAKYIQKQREQQSISAETDEQSSSMAMAHSPKTEDQRDGTEGRKKRRERTEERNEGEEDEDDKLQPPRFSLEILSDPGRLDAYIHLLKEFVYNVETLRRDMHGPPPLPSSMAAALRHHNNVHSPIPPSFAHCQLQQHSSGTAVTHLQQVEGTSQLAAKMEERRGEKPQLQQAVGHGHSKTATKGTPPPHSLSASASSARVAAKRERIGDEDVVSSTTVQSVSAKRLRVESVEHKDAQQRYHQSAQEIRKQSDELQGVRSSMSVQASTPPEDPRTNSADTHNQLGSSSQQQQPQSHLSLSSTVTTVVLSEPLLASSSSGRRSTTVTTTIMEPSSLGTSQPKQQENSAPTAGRSKINTFRNHPSLLSNPTANSAADNEPHLAAPVQSNSTIEPLDDNEPESTTVEVLSILNETTSTTAEAAADEVITSASATGTCKKSDIAEETVSASSTSALIFSSAPLMSKSGLWLGARDTDGALYFYHRDTREARWDLPEGEELLVTDKLNAGELVIVGGGNATASPPTELMGAERQIRRAEFKRHVSALVAKCIDPYRRRFFHTNGEYASFLRKITHKVLDNQPKSGNVELLFNEQVQKNTQRLVDEYIRHFKNRESHQIMHHRTDPQGFSPK